MNSNKIIHWVNDFFGFTVIMLALFGLTLAIMLGFVDNYSLSQNSINTVMLFMLSALIIQTAKFSDSSETRSDDIGKQTLDTRLQELINSLSQAGSAISGIEREIDSRHELVEKLEKQKMIAEEAIKLSKEQVDAVSALLSKQVAKQSRKDSRADWIKQIFFFILGVLVTILLAKLGLG